MEASNNKPYQFQVSFKKKSIDEFLNSLQQEALNHHAVNHPFLLSLAAGDLYDHEQALKDFTVQYHYYQQYFIRYLSIVISKLHDNNHRNIVIKKLMQQSGYVSQSDLKTLKKFGVDPNWVQGVAHTELYTRFMSAIGVHELEQNSSESLDVRCWIETLESILQNGSAAEAIGAISFGTANIVCYEYQHILTALIRYGKIDRKYSVFFDLYTLITDTQQKSYNTIAEYYAQTEQGRDDLHKGMRKALNLRVSFWDAMYRKNIFQMEQSQCA